MWNRVIIWKQVDRHLRLSVTMPLLSFHHSVTTAWWRTLAKQVNNNELLPYLQRMAESTLYYTLSHIQQSGTEYIRNSSISPIAQLTADAFPPTCIARSCTHVHVSNWVDLWTSENAQKWPTRQMVHTYVPANTINWVKLYTHTYRHWLQTHIHIDYTNLHAHTHTHTRTHAYRHWLQTHIHIEL